MVYLFVDVFIRQVARPSFMYDSLSMPEPAFLITRSGSGLLLGLYALLYLDTCSVVRFSNPSLTLFRYCSISGVALGPEWVWLLGGLVPV